MRSAVLKMLNDDVPDDRKIMKFPGPYRVDVSPYDKADFSEICYRYTKNLNYTSHLLNICKVIVIGDVSVGKTCIVNRFCQKIFDSNYKTTIGVDFEVEKFDILNVPFNLQIWDTAGQERFKCIAQSYYRGSHAIVIVFDLTNTYSLANCKTWLTEALNACTRNKPYIFLVGSKKDLLSKYAFKHVEHNAIKSAKKLNAEYWAVSSKTGENISELFFRIAAVTFDDSLKNELEKPDICKSIGSDVISFKKNKKEEKRKKNKCDSFDCQVN